MQWKFGSSKVGTFAVGLATCLAACLDGEAEHSEIGTLQAPLTAPQFPLELGPPDSRYIVDQQGTPFLFSGEAAWSLIVEPSLSEARRYLDDRRDKAFNVVMVNLVEASFSTNAPANHYGDAPFLVGPFGTPNEAYFAHADAVLEAAASRGIAVLLAPLYLGYDCGSQGWCSAVRSASTAEMRDWGRYVGERYRDFDNIIWLIGGDTNPAPVRSKVRAFAKAVRNAGARQLMTAHNAPESFAVSAWPNESWLDLNNLYTYDDSLYEQSLAAYRRTPIMPFFLLESTYENEHGVTPQTLRRQAYWPVLMGGMGTIFGNCPVWHFGSSRSWCGNTDWEGELDSPGAWGMRHAQRLFTSRAWHRLEPDVSHQVMVDGYGSFGSTSYATAARTSDGATVIAYLPAARPVTIDLNRLSGNRSNAWWYDPATGSASFVGSFSNGQRRTFSPPAQGDWVLVIDDQSRGYAAPGNASATDEAPAPPNQAPRVVHSASASPATVLDGTTDLSVTGTDDAGEASLTYTWSVVSAPTDGTVRFSANGTHASKMVVATFTLAGTYTLRVTLEDAHGLQATSDVVVQVRQSPPDDTTLTFQDLRNGDTLNRYGGVSWSSAAGGWKIWNGGWTYSMNAYIDNRSTSPVTTAFTIPAGTVLKSLKLAAGSGATATVTLRSSGNPDRVYPDVHGNYIIKQLGWDSPAGTVTVTVTCGSQWGASDLAFDDIVYGVP